MTVDKITFNLSEDRALTLSIEEARQLQKLLNDLLKPEAKPAGEKVSGDTSDTVREMFKKHAEDSAKRHREQPDPFRIPRVEPSWPGPYRQPYTLGGEPYFPPGTIICHW